MPMTDTSATFGWELISLSIANGAYRLAAAEDRLLYPAGNRHCSRFVDLCQVSGLEKPITGECFFVVLCRFKVTGKNIRAFCYEFPFMAWRDLPAVWCRAPCIVNRDSLFVLPSYR